MKKYLTMLFLCLLILPTFFSCSSGATQTIKEIDGNYYLTFPEGNNPIGETTSSIDQTLDFESIAEMKETFLGKKK